MASLQDDTKRIHDRLEREKSNPVRIAMFGQPGSGKSSLINALLGRPAAKVGARTDVTTMASCYKWRDDIEIWDLPGYGTSKFPPDSFIKRFKVGDYDLFLCVFDGKFTADDDAMFFEQVRTGGRPCILVSGKCDSLWEGDKPIEQIRDAIQEDVHSRVGSDARVLFVSARNKDGLGELQAAVFERLDPAKAARYAFAAKAYTQAALEKKREAAKGKITLHAALSAANAVNPIPGADVGVDLGILHRCFGEIREAFGLTREMLESPQVAAVAGPVANRILALFTTDGILALLKQLVGRQATRQFAKYVPMVGTVIAGAAGFTIVKLAGDSYVDDCHEVAAVYMAEVLGIPRVVD